MTTTFQTQIIFCVSPGKIYKKKMEKEKGSHLFTTLCFKISCPWCIEYVTFLFLVRENLSYKKEHFRVSFFYFFFWFWYWKRKTRFIAYSIKIKHTHRYCGTSHKTHPKKSSHSFIHTVHAGTVIVTNNTTILVFFLPSNVQ